MNTPQEVFIFLQVSGELLVLMRENAIYQIDDDWIQNEVRRTNKLLVNQIF